jgi:Ribbon-helix-helix domain
MSGMQDALRPGDPGYVAASNVGSANRAQTGSTSNGSTVESSLTESNNGDGPKRVNVTFTPQQYQVLRDLAAKQGVNISDVLRQAINITKLIVDANENGKILIEHNGEVQRLKLL